MKKLNYIFNLIVILLAAGALHAQSVNLDKTTLTFAAGVGGSAVTQNVAVTGSGGANTFFAVVGPLSSNSGGNQWLKIASGGAAPGSGTGGSLPGNIVVTADPTNLAAGQYTGQINVGSQLSALNQIINVTLNVSNISITPQSLQFTYQLNGSLPATQTLTLAGPSTNFNTSASTQKGGTWLQILPPNGTSPTSVQVSVNFGGSSILSLSPGTYNGSVVIAPTTGANTSPISIPVSLVVLGAPQVTLSSNSLTFNFQAGGANNQTQQSIQITTDSTQAVSYSVANFTLTPPGNQWFTVSSSSGTVSSTAPATLQVTVNPTGLNLGTYLGSFDLFTSGTPTQQKINLTLIVGQNPLLNLSTGSLTFNYQVAGALPAAQNVTATSTSVAASSTTGQLPLSFAITPPNSWLQVQTTAAVTGTPFSVSVSPAGLSPGTYTGTVSVSAIGAGNNPQTVNVTLKVSNDPLLVTNISGCSTLTQSNCVVTLPYQVGVSAIPSQTINVTSSTGAPLNYSVTSTMAANAGCGNSWLVVSGATTGSTDSAFNVSANVTGIAAGTQCAGTVTVNATNAANGNAVAAVNIPVNLYVSSTGLLTTAPAALNFTANQTAQQTVTVGSTSTTDVLNYIVTFDAPTGGNWLFVNRFQGNTTSPNNTIQVTVSPGGLTPGNYTATLKLVATNSANGTVADATAASPLLVPITLLVPAATLTVSTTPLQFTQAANGAAPTSQTIQVTSTGGTVSFTAAASTNGTGSWLTATPVGNAVQVSVNGASLTPGTYNGGVTITSTTPFTGNSPVTVPVVLVVTQGTISADQTTLNFSQVSNATTTGNTKTVNITSVPTGLPFSVAVSTDNNSGQWLTATATSNATTPGVVTVGLTAAAAALPVGGPYTGHVTITSPGAGGSPININVVLNVVNGQALTVSPTSLTFASVIGSATAPAAQSVQLTASGGAAPFTTAVTLSSGTGWLSVTPASGNTPATLTVTVNPTGLAAGTYTGAVAVNSTVSSTQPAVSIPVTLTVSVVAKPVIAAVGNAASYATGAVSPGENIVIFGSGLGPVTLTQGRLTSTGTVDTNVSNTRVLFDNVAAPIIYLGASNGTQISVMVPYGVNGRPTTSIVVENQGVRSDPLIYNVAAAAPGIYTANQSGSGPGVILNQDFSINSQSNAAAKGSFVQIYWTGDGVGQQSAPADGAITPTNGSALFIKTNLVTATVGGVPATVAYAGAAPGIVYGIGQVNIQIPANTVSGSVPVVLTINGVSTQNNVTVSVQ